MSARIIVAGRVVRATGSFVPFGRDRKYDTANNAGAPVDVLGPDFVDSAAPKVHHGRPPASTDVYTDWDGTNYRVVDAINPAECWVVAGTVMQWYRLKYETVSLWVRQGLLDGVLAKGSPTKWYRVLDPGRCEAAAKKAKGKPYSKRTK